MREFEIAILGGSSYLGNQFIDSLKHSADGFSPLYPPSSQVDISDRRRVRRWLDSITCSTIIDFAAFTDVSKAEVEEVGKAWRVNVIGTNNLAVEAARHQKKVVFISTALALASLGEQLPYTEDKRPKLDSGSLGTYALTKAVGEEIVRENCPNFAIIRIHYPMGGVRSDKDYLIKIINSIKKGFSLFDDQAITPTYIPDLIKALHIIVEKDLCGIFHIACRGETTPYEIGRYLWEKLGGDPSRVKNSCVGDNKRWPKNGVLDTRETERRLDIRFKTWKEAVDQIVLRNNYLKDLIEE